MKQAVLGKTAIKQITFLLQPYRWHLAISFVLVMLPGYFSVWGPYFIGRLIDDGLLQMDASILWLFGLALLFLKFFAFLFNALVQYCMGRFGLEILVDYRDHLLRRILSYPQSFFDKTSAGTLTTRVTNDISSVQELFSSALLPLVGNLVLVVGIMVAMIFMQWKLALFTLSVVPLIIFVTWIFDKRLRRRFGFMRWSLSNLNSFASESFSGHREIKTLNAFDGLERDFESFSRRLRDRFVKAVREYALYNPMIPFFTALMDVVIIVAGGWMVYNNSLSVGELVAFLAYANLFSWPVREFAEKYTVLQQALAAVDRLVEIAKPDPELDVGQRSLDQAFAVEFKGVGFRYSSDEPFVLKDLSFSVPAGSKVAIVGPTGSGKTTITSLMMRFYAPVEGSILVNGLPLESYSLDTLRSQLGWVSQDVFLFSRSLRENLSLGHQVSDSELWEVLKIVQLENWVRRLPLGLDTVFLERASQLSSGQRQLISLARALVRRPRLLIFDEATAYIDSLTEDMIQKAIEGLWQSGRLKDVTCFFIAHRLSTVKRCEYVLDLGDSLPKVKVQMPEGQTGVSSEDSRCANQ
jgi:ATP-binding cassette subfamily B protein